VEDYDDDQDAELPRDPAIDRAIQKLSDFFLATPRRLFYSTQIETTLERDFFHWITGKALLEMAQTREIHRIPETIQEKTVNFYAHPGHRYWRRELGEIRQLLDRIFHPDFTHAIGRHGELMFDAALGRNGFRTEATNTKEWQGRMWTTTNHNLDRIVTRDGRTYGVEIKNTQNYISRQELTTKIQLCQYLQVTPLFIMRFAPKSYIHQVNQARGFVLLFEEQMYPLGHSALLTEVRTKLNLKVNSLRDVKEGDIQRLLNWHNKQPTP